MKEQSLSLQDTTIRQQCKHLRMPTIGLQFRKLAEEAVREQQTPVRYLEALLGAEIEERERRVVERRIREAHLPRMKTLDEFDFSQAPKVPVAQIRELAEGGLRRACRASAVNRRMRSCDILHLLATLLKTQRFPLAD